MKRFNILFGFTLSVLLFTSCYKDNGNYSYEEQEQITITGIEGAYNKISDVDYITLDPEVSSNIPGAEFSYFWGMYETNVQGYAPKIDTIAKTKSLNYLVKRPAKTWVLVFGVKNDKTGVIRLATSNINVITQYTRGWYVLKSDGGVADLDLFFTPQSIVPDPTPLSNVFNAVNEKNISGDGVKLSFCTNYKSTVTGVLGNTRSLFILSDKDASVVDISTFKEIKPLQDMFFEAPAVKNPRYVGEGSAANYFVNDGKLHSIYAMSANIGKFGGVTMRDDYNSDYDLGPYCMTSFVGNPVFYDNISASFVSSTGTASVMTAITGAAASEMSPANTGKDLLFMGLSLYSNPMRSYAIFRDRADPSLKLFSTLTVSGYTMTINNDTLATTSKIYNAEKYGVIYQDELMMYFSVGNEIWSRNAVNGNEAKQYTLPAGEQVEFISHRKFASTNAAETNYVFNYVIIGTSMGGNYKVRMFRKTSGNLLPQPDFTLEGKGACKDIIYMSPNVSGYTYYNQ